MLEAPAVEKSARTSLAGSASLSFSNSNHYSHGKLVGSSAEASCVTMWKRFPNFSPEQTKKEKKKNCGAKKASFIQISYSFKETSFWI